MRVLIAVLFTAIASVGITMLVARRHATGESTVSSRTTSALVKPSQAWLDLKKRSAELDARLSDALKGDARNSAEASTKLKSYRNYCDSEMDLFSKQEALYRKEHGSEDSPILIEQEEATGAWCDRVRALYSFMADPKNEYRVEGDEISASDVPTYNRLMLAFRVASIRLVNANAAETNEESRQ